RRVNCEMGKGLKRNYRRDVDYCPFSRSHHPRQNSAHKSHNRVYIQPDRAQFLADWGGHEIPTGGDAGVVDKEADATEFPEASHNRIEPVDSFKIGDERLDPALLLSRFARQGLQPLLSPRDCEHAVSAPRELLRKRSAHARRGAGDDSPALR